MSNLKDKLTEKATHVTNAIKEEAAHLEHAAAAAVERGEHAIQTAIRKVKGGATQTASKPPVRQNGSPPSPKHTPAQASPEDE